MQNQLRGLEFLKPFVKSKKVETEDLIFIHRLLVRSKALGYKMRVDIYLPPSYYTYTPTSFPTLIINDGQDMEQLRLTDTLSKKYRKSEIPEIVVVAIHARDRMNEYGIADRPDYMNRGNKAAGYTRFLTRELIPYVYKSYRCLKNSEETVIGGFSLGGLSAMDIGWHHDRWFSKVAVFSGSFWWRSEHLDENDPDADRMMIDLICKADKVPSLDFFFQVGTKDEECDRNGNGVIDAIDDTKDVIKALKNKGFAESQITYLEILDGEHNFPTWSQVFPEFLSWAFPKKSVEKSTQ